MSTHDQPVIAPMDTTNHRFRPCDFRDAGLRGDCAYLWVAPRGSEKWRRVSYPSSVSDRLAPKSENYPQPLASRSESR